MNEVQAKYMQCWMITKIISWFRCLFHHDWQYNFEGIGTRRCRRCGRKEYAYYDPMYGTTHWQED